MHKSIIILLALLTISCGNEPLVIDVEQHRQELNCEMDDLTTLAECIEICTNPDCANNNNDNAATPSEEDCTTTCTLFLEDL